MGYENELVVVSEKSGKCRNGVFDSFIVGNGFVRIEWYIEIDAYNNFFIDDFHFVDELHG